MKITYSTYWALLDLGPDRQPLYTKSKACDKDAFFADIKDAYGDDIRIIIWGLC